MSPQALKTTDFSSLPELPATVRMVPFTPPRTRCLSCGGFLSIQPYINLESDWLLCRSCGKKNFAPDVCRDFDFALGIEPEGSRQQTVSSSVGLIHEEPGPKGNAQQFSNLRPNGKIKKKKQKAQDFQQLDMFIPEVIEMIDIQAVQS